MHFVAYSTHLYFIKEIIPILEMRISKYSKLPLGTSRSKFVVWMNLPSAVGLDGGRMKLAMTVET